MHISNDLEASIVLEQSGPVPSLRNSHHYLPRRIPFCHPLEAQKSAKGRQMTEGGSHTSSRLSCSHSTQFGGYPPPNRLSSPTWIWTRLIEAREVSLDRRGYWSVGGRDQRDTRCSSETPKIPNTSIVFKDGNTVSDRSMSTNLIGYCGRYKYLSSQLRLGGRRKDQPRNR